MPTTVIKEENIYVVVLNACVFCEERLQFADIIDTQLRCSFLQYSYADPVREYNAMVYVKRKDTFHIDSTDLYGEYNSFDVHDELCLSKIHTNREFFLLSNEPITVYTQL